MLYAAVAGLGDLAVKGKETGRLVGALAVKLPAVAGRTGDLAVKLPAVAGRTVGDLAAKLPAADCRMEDGTIISCVDKSPFWPMIGRVSSDLGDQTLGLAKGPGITPRERPRERELPSRLKAEDCGLGAGERA